MVKGEGETYYVLLTLAVISMTEEGSVEFIFFPICQLTCGNFIGADREKRSHIPFN